MKRVFFLVLLILLCVYACKKTNSSDQPVNWSADDQAFYNSVMALQDQASANFTSWSQSSDSLTALNRLQQFFAASSLVTSATLGTQGIAVQYTNGMRGGIFLNPEDEPDNQRIRTKGSSPNPEPLPFPKSLVNLKKAIFLNPNYWDRSPWADSVITNYNANLPKAHFVLSEIYKNTDVTLDRLTALAGHGIIHIYSHGLAWPKRDSIKDVYVMTGEVANNTTSNKYWDDMRHGLIATFMVRTAIGRRTVYLVNKDFIIGHNNFSKDTVLFYGGFCYSGLGKWDSIIRKFGSGSYFGFNWSVYTNKNAAWNRSLIDSLCDTNAVPPYTSDRWLQSPLPVKFYFNSQDNKTVSVDYSGDSQLTFFRPPSAGFTWTVNPSHSGNVACLNSLLTVKDTSLDYGSKITNWQWYFSGGDPDSYTGKQPPAITLNTLGTCIISLYVSNKYGTTNKQVGLNVVQCK